MKCNKCKSTKDMNRVTVSYIDWENLRENIIKSKEVKLVYICNSCGAVQDIPR